MDVHDSGVFRLALTGTVDAEAPARATGSIDIDAPRAAVWDALAHVENWPGIRADVTDVRASGAPVSGGAFTWLAGGVPVTSALALVERPTRLTWANTAPGMAMACVYELDELSPHRTRLRCAESMDAAAVAPHIDHDVLAGNIRSWIEGLRAFVEADRSSAHGSR